MTLTGSTFAALSAALVTIGVAFAIAKLAAASVESMARQPEIAAQIRLTMIIAAGLIEGVAFFCAYICMSALGS